VSYPKAILEPSLPNRRQTLTQRRKISESKDRPTESVWPIVVYLILLCVPISFAMGSLHLPPFRLFLLIMLLPSLIKYMRAPDGRVYAPDILIFLYVAWCMMTILLAQGISAGLEAAGSLAVEVLGGFFLARAWVRDAPSFQTFSKLYFWLVAILLPFALFEALTGNAIILQLVGKLVRVFSTIYMEPRLGLDRAQGPFEHPILFGVFCSVAFGLCLYTLQIDARRFRRPIRLLIVTSATFLSLSTGAYLSVVAQGAFAAWDRFVTFSHLRWRLLLVLSISAYIAVDALSNRTPFAVFITYLTFDAHNSYMRILIWEYGTAEVYRHPLLGLGLFTDWIRPEWMHSTSIDNFWLLRAMRHGLPAVTLLIGTVLWVVVKLSRLKLAPANIDACRRGLLMAIGGLSISLVTVDVWNGLHSLFWFLLGCSMWLLNPSAVVGGATSEPTGAGPHHAKPENVTRPVRPPAIVATQRSPDIHPVTPRRQS